MQQIADGKVPNGFRVVRPRRVPALYLLRQLRALVTDAALRRMILDVRQHGAGKWTIRRVRPLPTNHPDRVCGHDTYTHTVLIRYRPKNRPGIWECVYGVTSDGRIHLWMD